jgi:GH15 family glucan-1,4-alpha-glucosidase
MLWSFPGLLDADPAFAREALTYALTVQRRNIGTHSRFIDGTVLEDGFQLDEAVAPLIALTAYVSSTGDTGLAKEQAAAIDEMERRLLSRRDAATGLYESMQDAQDEYQKRPFITYDNVLVWKAWTDLAVLRSRLGERERARETSARATALRQAILAHTLTGDGPNARFVSATDGQDIAETDIPPGSLLTLPALGFLPESDPRFVATYRWLHSSAYRYSYADAPYGLPGSYRLPFTTVWTLAAELGLTEGRAKALAILRASAWDAGIATEGIDPVTAQPDRAGRAFATAAGYLAHAICAHDCTDHPTNH